MTDRENAALMIFLIIAIAALLGIAALVLCHQVDRFLTMKRRKQEGSASPLLVWSALAAACGLFWILVFFGVYETIA